MKYKFLYFNILQKRKLCKFSIIMFTITFILCTLTLGLKNGVYNKYKEINNSNIDHSYLIVNSDNTYEDLYKDIKRNKNITQVYPILLLNDNIVISSFDSNLITILQGNYPKNKNEIIVPSNSQKNINDIIEINNNNISYKLKIVGIYDLKNQPFIMNYYWQNIVYTTSNFLNDISNESNINGIIIQINDYQNVKSTIKQLENYNITLMNNDNAEVLNRYYNYYNSIKNISNIILILSFLVVIIVEFIIFHDNKLNIAIMKSIGYSSKKLALLTTFYSQILTIISLTISCIIITIIYILLKNLIILNINILIQIVIVFAIIKAITSFILFLIINKINITKFIKDE